MTANDGAFNQVQENVQAELVTNSLGPGRHTIFVRGRDNNGVWGPVSAVFYTQTTDSQIQGHVTDASNGYPLPGAQVDLHGKPMSVQATTDGQGNYFAQVVSGTYTATATLFAYFPEVVSGVAASTAITTTQDFSLTALPTGTLDGMVTDSGSSSPLQATIVIRGTPVTLLSDPHTGVFSTTLPIGTYTIVVSAPGYFDFTLPGLQILTGQVTNETVFLSRLPAPIFLPLIRAGGS
jgi:hypothetical protein